MPSRIFGSWAPPPTLGGGAEEMKNEEAKKAKEMKNESWDCGGTSHILPRERANASFETLKLTMVLDGGAKATVHRRWLWDAGEQFDNSGNYFFSRDDMLEKHIERFIGIHKKYAEEGYTPKPEDIMIMVSFPTSSFYFERFLSTRSNSMSS